MEDTPKPDRPQAKRVAIPPALALKAARVAKARHGLTLSQLTAKLLWAEIKSGGKRK